MKLSKLTIFCIAALITSIVFNTVFFTVFRYSGIEERLQPYFIDFKKEMSSNGIDLDLDVVFATVSGEFDTEVIAYCNNITSFQKIIRYNPYYFFNSSEESRLATVYHELGHCMFDIDHIDGNEKGLVGEYGNLCPDSLMTTYGDTYNGCFFKYKEYYIKELLTHVKK